MTHDPSEYGAHIADAYDVVWAAIAPDTEGAVDCLAHLADDGGPVLELGIGTGRLALPLAARGIEVHGVDGSPAMVEQLHAKPGGEAIPVTIGDFSTTRVPGTFGLVVLAINTIYALPDQEAQIACFATAAAHLRPGGRFVVEAWVPDPHGPPLRTLAVTTDGVLLEARQVDAANQRMATQKILIRNGDVRSFPANHRYAWPAELDLMARLTGLDLEHRWADWHHSPFTTASTNHVSVYQRH